MSCCGERNVQLDSLVVGPNGSRVDRKNRRIYKVVLLGDTSVGKTCLLRRFVRQEFANDYKATIGADFLSKEIEIDGCKVTLQIWDTAGQERFHSLGVVFYRGADACGFVCDVGNESTLDSIDKWRREFGAVHADNRQEQSSSSSSSSSTTTTMTAVDDVTGVPSVLFANKCDVPVEQRVITTEKLKLWSDSHGNMTVFQTSAQTNQGVQEAFEQLARMCLANDLKQ